APSGKGTGRASETRSPRNGKSVEISLKESRLRKSTEPSKPRFSRERPPEKSAERVGAAASSSIYARGIPAFARQSLRRSAPCRESATSRSELRRKAFRSKR